MLLTGTSGGLVMAGFWIAQADGIYAVVSTSLLLAVVALVLRPGSR